MAKRTAYHHGALRQTLIDRALRALERDGLEDLSLRALALEIGVSKTAPYRHFRDKHSLLAAMAAEGFRKLADRLTHALEDAGDAGPPTAAIRALFHAYLGLASDTPAMYRLMFSRLGFSLHSEECRLASERALGCLRIAVEAAQVRGWRKGEATLSLVLSLWALVHGWAGITLDGLHPPDTPDPREVILALLS